jgi:hypothetical protein
MIYTSFSQNSEITLIKDILGHYILQVGAANSQASSQYKTLNDYIKRVSNSNNGFSRDNQTFVLEKPDAVLDMLISLSNEGYLVEDSVVSIIKKEVGL